MISCCPCQGVLLSQPPLHTCSTVRACLRFYLLFSPQNESTAQLALQLPRDQCFSSAGDTTPGLHLVLASKFSSRSGHCLLSLLLSFCVCWGISFAWQMSMDAVLGFLLRGSLGMPLNLLRGLGLFFYSLQLSVSAIIWLSQCGLRCSLYCSKGKTEESFC